MEISEFEIDNDFDPWHEIDDDFDSWHEMDRGLYKPEIEVDEEVCINDIPDCLAGFFADLSSVKCLYRRKGVEIFFCQPPKEVYTEDVVIKISFGKDVILDAIYECLTLRHLQEKAYVVKMHDYYVQPERPQVILLEEPLQPLEKKAWKEPSDVFKLGIQLCDIFADLLREGITYHDISIKNILFRKGSKQPVLSDFNCVTWGSNYPKSVVGTPPYIAPEIFDHREYGEPAEVYALGVLLSKLLMEKEYDYFFPYDDIPTKDPFDECADEPCLDSGFSEIDDFFRKYPSLANAVNKDRKKRYMTFEELKKSINNNELRTY